MKKPLLQEINSDLLHVIYIGGVIVALMAIGLFATAAWGISQPKGRVSCASFGSYNEALRAYTGGASWLDHDGDGIPCEDLYRRDGAYRYGE